MTFDEIQRTLETMLSVQRELQESQLRQQQDSAKFERNIQSIHEELDRILAVQRDLQESQVSQQQQNQAIQQEIQNLLAAQQEQRRLIDRLIGYSLSNESDHLDLHERMNRLEERMRQIGR
ncbi:hypothetical protein C8255_08220 [filamentous cyanobacterium CCP3]|nr:hypothetical protein C8255_08220 [filamentous cyanobacterium CCP3]